MDDIEFKVSKRYNFDDRWDEGYPVLELTLTQEGATEILALLEKSITLEFSDDLISLWLRMRKFTRDGE